MKFLLVLAAVVIFANATAEDELSRNYRIVGGTSIQDIRKWPWLVSLTAQTGTPGLSTRTYYCGASVINKRWLLSAAHCTEKGAYLPRYWTARLASIKRWATGADWTSHRHAYGNKDKQQYEYGIEKIITHDDYSRKDGFINDIALFKLKRDLPLGPDMPWIKAVDLPVANDSSFPPDGQMCWMKGWGCTSNGGSVAYWAQEVELPIAEHLDCYLIHHKVNKKAQICAGYFQKQKGVCKGDSGGPLVCKKGDEWEQVGIASFGAADKPGELYEVYTRVSSYIDWIKKIIAEY